LRWKFAGCRRYPWTASSIRRRSVLVNGWSRKQDVEPSVPDGEQRDVDRDRDGRERLERVFVEKGRLAGGVFGRDPAEFR
jgi:hypothetical protein